MIANLRQPARNTATVSSDLQATVNLRAAVVRSRAEVDADLDAAVAACIRAGTSAAFEKIHARAAALADLASRLFAREAALRTELNDCEAWDKAAPERAARAAQERERQRIADNPQNATFIVEEAIRAADPGEKQWQSRGHNSCAPADVAQLPGCRLGAKDEPFAVVVNRNLLDEALRAHRAALVRSGVPGVLAAIARERLGHTPWQTPGVQQGHLRIGG